MKRLLAKKGPLIPSDLWQEIEKLKERNRQLHLKIGKERRENIEKISELEHRSENLMIRNQEKQARLDEFEIEQPEEDVRAEYNVLLESSTAVTNKLREEVRELRSQLAAECADREEIEAELADLKQNSAIASELPEAADLLNQLKAKRKKSSATLADIEAILGMIEESAISAED